MNRIARMDLVAEELEDILLTFTAITPDDPAKAGLELHCEACGHHLCDIEHSDTLNVLVSVAIDHACTT